MELSSVTADGIFDLSDGRCLAAVILWSAICGALCFIIIYLSSRILSSTRPKELWGQVAIIVLFIVLLVLVSGCIQSMLASIIATIAMNIGGQAGSFGFPWGRPPMLPALAGCVLGVSLALWRLRSKKVRIAT